jgi:nitrite reductase (NADH) large subunit
MRHVIVGNGVAGVTAAQAIRQADPSAELSVIGGEPYPYYRRPLLWKFIAGQIGRDAIVFRPAEWYEERGIRLRLGIGVTALEPEDHSITLADNSKVVYDRLLLATGARSQVLDCGGVEKEGVFTLHSLDDAVAVKAYAGKVSKAIVVGGGLLGLETAGALRMAGLEVTVVEFLTHLLPRQLDVEGANVLQSLLEAQGLRIVTSAETDSILGDACVRGIHMRDGRAIDGDIVVFSTGIRPEINLAKAAGLRVNRGVVVNHRLQTSVEGIFAAGDAAEFEGQVYGIIPPAIDQARIAAANMVAPDSAVYAGTLPSTTLEVAGAEVTTLGEALVDGEEYTKLRKVDIKAGQYRKLVLRDKRIVGAILLNDSRSRPIKRLIEQKTDVSNHIDQLLDDRFDLNALQ